MGSLRLAASRILRKLASLAKQNKAAHGPCCRLVFNPTLRGYLKSQHKSIRLPPGPPRLPVFGNLLQLGQQPHQDVASLCDKKEDRVHCKSPCWRGPTTGPRCLGLISNRKARELEGSAWCIFYEQCD
uniref:Uncharacterized protein n=1 Tax=Populus trichocarpa TaxID=3694 RepID=A0A2K1XT73_POPTR